MDCVELQLADKSAQLIAKDNQLVSERQFNALTAQNTANYNNLQQQIERELYLRKIQTPALYKNQKRKVTPDSGFDYVWEKSVLLKILRDEQYTGTYVAGKSVTLDVGSGKQIKKPESEWIRIPAHHPAIISSELFEKVQTILNSKSEPLRKREIGTSERYTRSSPLKGKVFCACCGHTMTQSNTKNTAFHCRFTLAAPDAPCHRLHKLDDQLCGELIRAIRELAEGALTRPVVDLLIEKVLVFPDGRTEIVWKQ